MRAKKWEMNSYQPCDGAAMAAHLEKQAAQGWHLEKLGHWGLTYRRGEPKRVHYTVTYFPEASIFDGVPGEKQGTYIDYCAAAGWELAGNLAQIQIFRSEREDPVPIETDEETKLKAIHGTAKKTILWANALLLVVWAMNLGMRLHDLLDAPVRFLSGSANLWLLVMILGLVAETTLTLAEYTIWYLRSRRSVARGGACARYPTAFRQARLRLLLAVSVLGVAGVGLDMADAGHGTFYLCAFAGMALLMAACTWVIRGLRRRRAKEGAWGIYIAAVIALSLVYTGGITVLALRLPDAAPGREPVGTYTTDYGSTWDLYRDDLPVTLEDLGYTVTDADACTYEVEESKSILMTRREYRQRAYSHKSDLPDLQYQVTEIRWDWLREWVVSRYVERYDLAPDETTGWDAERVYTRGLEDSADPAWYGRYFLVTKGEQVLLLNRREDLSAERFVAAWRWE